MSDLINSLLIVNDSKIFLLITKWRKMLESWFKHRNVCLVISKQEHAKKPGNAVLKFGVNNL